MRKKLTIIVAVVAIVAIVAATAAYLFTNNSLSEQEKARNAAMNYIKTNHPETAYLMENMNWEGGLRSNYQAGSITYIYTSTNQGWTVILQSPTDSIHNYTIQASTTQGTILVNWHGTYQDNIITETSFKNTP